MLDLHPMRHQGRVVVGFLTLLLVVVTPLLAAPTLNVTAPADGALVATPTVDVSGTASDPTATTTDPTTVTVNGLAASISAETWLVRGLPLLEGSNSLVVRAENGSGEFTEVTRTVVLDTTAPTVAVTEPAPGTVVPTDTYLLRGTAVDPHLLRVEVTGAAGTAAATLSSGIWEHSVALVEGNNTFTLAAIDTLGHRSETTVALVRDSEAPSVQITTPAEGLRTSVATVEVVGSVDPELVEGVPSVTVTVAGVSVPVAVDGGFSLADVALAEGDNRLTARATDALGNQGTHTRDVVLDTVAPSLVSANPPSGALAVDVGARVDLDFDEPLAAPAAGSWRLEEVDPDSGATTPLAADAVVSEARLTVTPAAPLPSSATIRLVLTDALLDLAGNALSTEIGPETTLEFTTADASAPAAPAVDAVPTDVCAASWTLAGSAEPDSTVRVTGGASLAETRVGDDGSFSLAVDLGEGSNTLELTASDSAGNTSSAVAVDIVRDCQPPAVTSATLLASGASVTLSEPVTAASIAARLWLEGGSGPLAGSVALSGDGSSATFTSSASLPGGPLRLVVAAGVEDLAGNALASDYAQLLGAGTADSFLSGTTLDASTGRPLAGVRVVATARDGVALADPKPEVTTAEGGRFLLSLPAGSHELTVAREGFTPVFRRVTTVADGGVEVFAPRLTPEGPATAMGGGATTVTAGEAGSKLDLPSGALPTGTTVRLSDLDEQALPAPLPYGWSPRGAAWLDLGVPLQADATLDLAVSAPVGESLVLAGLDLATLAWRALPAAEVVDPVTSWNQAASTQSVRLTIPNGSEVVAVAALAADTGAMAPPVAVAGELLGSGPTPLGSEVSAASLGFDPPVVLPSQRSRVQVDYTVDTPVASGAPLTVRVEETLQTAEGSQPGPAFEVDLRLFHDATGEPGSRFWLRPSEQAASAALVSGEERVEVHPWVGSGSTGGVVDPTGGTVTSTEGDRLEIPAGALAAPAAVTLTRREVTDLPLAPPSEGTVAGVLEVGLEGPELLLAARLVLALDPPPTAGSRGLLLQVVEIAGSPRYRVVAEVEATAQGWETVAIDPLDLPWPGVRSGGLYAVLEPTVDLGFARGTVLGIDGVTPVAGVVVEASLGAALGGPPVSWLQLSSPEGSYALALPAAQALVLIASDPASGDGVAVAEAALTTDERRDRDLALLPVGPEVLDLVPAPGATGVPLGIEPTVTFSEAVDPASIAGEVELWVDGAPWPVDPVVEGALVRLLPQASLPAATEVTLRVGLGVLDLQGHPTPNPVTATFTTAADSGSSAVDRRRIRLIAPDAGGQVQVLGLSGAVPDGSTVFVENQTSFSTTETVTAAQDGSFAISLAASLTDRLLLRVVLPDGTDVFLVLGPFLSTDQRSALVGGDAATFTTGDGITVHVPAGAVSNPGWIRLALEPAANRPVELPAEMTALYDVVVDLGEVVLGAPLEIELAAPAGLGAEPLLLLRVHEAFGRRGWMLHDLMRAESGVVTTVASGTLASLSAPAGAVEQRAEEVAGKDGPVYPEAGTLRLLQPEQMAALARPAVGGVRVLPAVPRRAPQWAHRSAAASVGQGPTLAEKTLGEKTSAADVEQHLQGLGFDGYYTVVAVETPLALVRLPVPLGMAVVALSDTFGEIPVLADSSVALEGRTVTQLVIPSRLGEEYTLEVRNLRSGYELFNQLMAPPTEEFVNLSGTLLRDDDAPVLVSGSPLDFHILQSFADGTWAVAEGITLSVDGSNATLTGLPGATASEATVQVVALDGVGESKAVVAASDGSFALGFDTGAGARHLLGLGGVVRSSSALELSFSEALGDDLTALRIERQPAGSNAWQAIALDTTPVGSREVFRLQPTFGWQPGNYRLVIAAGLPDRMVPPNPSTWSLVQPFTVEGTTSLGTGVDIGPVRDLARLGSLLFVAGDTGVGIYDVSDPRQPRPYLPGNLQMPFPHQATVRGLTVDAHGRLIAVGGGSKTFGLLQMLDVTALDLSAIASDPDARLAGWRGTTLVSEYGSTDTVVDLRVGNPGKVAVLPNEEVRVFFYDEAALPADLVLTPSAPAQGELAYRATLGPATPFATPGQAVTLHNRTRGTWHRLDADGAGDFSFELRVEPHPLARTDSLGGGVEPDLLVAPGDRLELVADHGGLAYVTVAGTGMAVVDLGTVYDGAVSDPNDPTLSDVLAYVPPFQVDTSVPCDLGSPLVSGQPTDVGVLVDPSNPEPLVVPVLLERYGVALYRPTDPSTPADLVALGQICGAVEGTARMSAMEVVQGYPLAVDLDGDGVAEPESPRDVIVVAHSAGHLLAFDVTDRGAPVHLGRVELPGNARALSVDRATRTVLVAGEQGFAAVRFDTPWGDAPNTDQVLEWVPLGSEATDVLALPELGLVWLGSNDVDADGATLRGLSLDAPRIDLVSAAPGIPQAVSRVAPLGVPTASPGGVPIPAWVRLQAVLPPALAGTLGGGVGDLPGGAIAFDLESQGPGGLEIDGLAPIAGVDLPSTSLRDLTLRRQGRHPWEQGYGLFVSDPVVLLADLRAMADYDRTPLEDAVCNRCDPLAEGIYPGNTLPAASNRWPELLGGHQLAARWPSDLRVALSEIYTGAMLDAAEIRVDSVPWDLSPSPRQEPTLNPSFGTGDVAPGTLLHSGEFSHQVTDVAVPGRGGLDLAFTRTYRSQTVGDGPLGPGWDHVFRARLRPLPNGDVEFFDGRGRRETFEPLGSDQYRPPAGRFVWLKRTTRGWQMQDAGGSNLLFDRWGRLTAIFDPFNDKENEGTRLTLGYDSASRLTGVSTHGRHLAFGYDTDGRMIEISDHSGRVYTLDYSDGRLIESTTPAVVNGPSQFPAGITTACDYETPGAGDTLAEQLNRRDNMIALSQPYDASDAASRVDWLVVEYEGLGDDRDLVETQTWGDPGDVIGFSYSFADLRTRVVDRRGNQAVYHHTAEGHLSRLTDRALNETTWTYGAYPDREHGLPKEIVLASGRKLSYVYEEQGQPLQGRSFRRLGNVVQVSEHKIEGRSAPDLPDTLTATQSGFDVTRQVPSLWVDPDGRKSFANFDKDGFASAVRTILGLEEGEAVTVRDSNEFGEPVTEESQRSDESSHRVKRGYSDEEFRAGFLDEVIVDPEGLDLTTRYETDSRGNVTEVIDPRGVRHEFEYNALDWLVEARLGIAVGSGGEPGLAPVDERRRYVYDARGNVVEVHRSTAPGGAAWQVVSRATFGSLDEPLSIEAKISDLEWARQDFAYDANRNLVRWDGPSGERMTTVYDPRNLPTTRQALRHTDGTGDVVVEETRVYDAMGLVTQRSLGGDRTWTLEYDGYDRLLTTIDPSGNTSTTHYDGAGNPVREVFADASEVQLAENLFSYDGGQRLTRLQRWLSEPDGQSTYLEQRWVYDELSNLRSTVDGRGSEVIYEYDDAQRPIGSYETLIGHGVGVVLDPAGNPLERFERTGVAQPQSLFAVTTTFDALGRPLTVTDGEGHQESLAYDPRGRLIRRIAPGPGNPVTHFEYDDLDRLTRRTRPNGIQEVWGYDLSSRQTSYSDALGNETQWTYDGLSDVTAVVYPDGDTETYEYDVYTNLVKTTRSDGTVVESQYDVSNRLTGRTIDTAGNESVGGVLSESYQYDGLNRLVRGVSGTGAAVTTDLAYDTLSRLVGESQGGRSQGYSWDAADNPAGTLYPSGLSVIRDFDVLNRLATVEEGPGPFGVHQYASYGYRGTQRVSSRRYEGVALQGTTTFDLAGRPLSREVPGVFEELLSWTERSQLASQIRGDLDGTARSFAYDDANRLTASHWSTPEGSDLAGFGSFAFTHDSAQNLLTRTETTTCDLETVSMPLPAAGQHRNLPTSVGGQSLEWDDNGNLVEKGDRKFVYDYRNRLVEVKDLQDNVLARYTYDVFDRRVHRDVTGQQPRVTVWDGWQAIEEYRIDGNVAHLASRRIYGRGLDEIVVLEQEMSGALEGYVPYYDALGNLALVTDLDANVVERYEYTPLGERRIFVDSTPPTVTQIRWADSALHVELSEPVQRARFLDAFSSGASQLINHDQGDALVLLEAPEVVGTGRSAGRHWILRPAEPAAGEPDLRPQPGESLTLTIAASGLVDYFGKQPSGDLFTPVTWPASETVIEDATAPYLEAVCVTTEGRIEIELSEIVDFASLGTITIDGNPTTWTSIGDGRVVQSPVLTSGSHSLDIPTTVTDLVGLGLEAGQTASFEVTSGQVAAIYFRPPAGQETQSQVGNPFGFKGLPFDEETGFYYVRRRYYDPELGRFITQDPYGYIDGPSMTAYAMNDPVNLSDPMGEYAETAWDAASLGIGIASFRYNVGQGNFGLATLDALGIVVDSAALATPLPGGVGALRNGKRFWDGVDAARQGSGLVQGVRRAQLVDQSLNVAQGLVQARDEFREGGASGYGMGSFYFGMSALGVRGVVAGVKSDATTSRVSTGAADPWQAALERGESIVDPNTVRFSQRSAGGGKPPRAPQLRGRMAGGWDPDLGPIDVMRTPDGLLSLDNTRVAVAQELGMTRITARVRGADELLPSDIPAQRLQYFEFKAKKLGLPSPKTWGDLFRLRTKDNRLPPTGTSQRPRMPGG